MGASGWFRGWGFGLLIHGLGIVRRAEGTRGGKERGWVVVGGVLSG